MSGADHDRKHGLPVIKSDLMPIETVVAGSDFSRERFLQMVVSIKIAQRMANVCTKSTKI